METLESMVEKARENQFKATPRPPEMIRMLVNEGDIIINPSSKDINIPAVLIMPKNLEAFAEFKNWADNESIPTYCTKLDEYNRDIGIILWDKMPLNNRQANRSMVIRLDVEVEASGEDIMSVMLRYYSI